MLVWPKIIAAIGNCCLYSICIVIGVEKGEFGETYLVSSRNEQRNIDVVMKILSLLGKNHDLIHFVSDRPGHDVRYAINPEKIEKTTGWKSSFQFDKALEMTIKMYTQHK